MNKKIFFGFVVFLLLTSVMLVCSQDVSYTPDSDTTRPSDSTQSSGNVVDSVGSVLGVIFGHDLSSKQIKMENHYWFRIALFLILMSILGIASKKVGLMNKKGAFLVTLIVSFITVMTLSASSIIDLFDIVSLMLLVGIIFIFIKKFFEAMGWWQNKIAMSILYGLLSIFFFSILNPTSRFKDTFAFMLDWNIKIFIVSIPIGRLLILAAAIYFGYMAIITLATGNAEPRAPPVPGFGRARAAEGIAQKIPPLKADIARLGSMIDNGQVDEGNIQQVIEQIQAFEARKIQLSKERDELNLGLRK